jgi:nicotinamidase/pyrazinamidase
MAEGMPMSASQFASQSASAALRIAGSDVLLVIDPQQDFCSGGQLAVPDGDAVIPLINQIATRFAHVILTQDWHPANHTSFASNHPNTRPYDQIRLEYGHQTLWPNHCVQGTPGAEFHPGLHIPQTELILRKGFRPQIDSYSAFLENDKTTPTGLAGYLRERGFKRIFLAGLAYDYCVRFSAIDGQRAGFAAIVLEDACRAVAVPGSVEATRREFADARVLQVMASEIGV